MDNALHTSLENAAKMLMIGLISIAVSIGFSALCRLSGSSTSSAPSSHRFQVTYPDVAATNVWKLFDPETGTMYLSRGDGFGGKTRWSKEIQAAE